MDSFPCNAHWANYIDTLNKLGIPEEKVNFYLMWVKRYVRFLNGLPIDQASSDIVKAFILYLGKDLRVKDWQIRQAEDAVAILYKDLEKVLVRNSAAPESIPFRDTVVDYKDLEIRYGNLFKRFECEIATEHLAIRLSFGAAFG
jgi:hypothetical protein